MNALRLTKTIKIRDGNPYVLITGKQARMLKPNWHRPMPVSIQINKRPEVPWKINMMPVGDGSFYLYLHGEVRKASSTGVGDVVTIDVVFDSEYKNGPQHPMPEWFYSALHENELAKNNWDALPPSRQKEILRYFSWLKSEEAKQRNLKKALWVLSGKPGRFMARSWKRGK